MNRLKSVSWYIKEYWWKYLLVMLLSLAIIYCDIRKPKIIGEAVDLIGLGQITDSRLKVLLILFISIVLVKFLFSTLKSIFLGNLFHKLFYKLKMKMLNGGKYY